MCVKLVNRILLGLLMLVPGLIKLFVFKPSGVTGMLTGFGFPLPMFFAWLLIISEIIFGIAILANWRVQYTALPPIIILVIAMLVTLPWGEFSKIQASTALFHLVAASNYWLISQAGRTKSKMHEIGHGKK